MATAQAFQFDVFITKAIAHRHWLTSQRSHIVAGSETFESEQSAILGAIREVDKLICHVCLESFTSK